MLRGDHIGISDCTTVQSGVEVAVAAPGAEKKSDPGENITENGRPFDC
jgi:hypothetical protein